MKAESVSVEKAKTMISCEISGRCTFHHPAFRLIKEGGGAGKNGFSLWNIAFLVLSHLISSRAQMVK